MSSFSQDLTGSPAELANLVDGSSYLLQNNGLGEMFLYEGAEADSDARKRKDAIAYGQKEKERIEKASTDTFFVWSQIGAGHVSLNG